MTPTEREYIWVGVHGCLAVWALVSAVLAASVGDPVFTVVLLGCTAFQWVAAQWRLRRVRRLVRGGR